MVQQPIFNSKTLSIYPVSIDTLLAFPFIGSVHAGFPSPAADFLDTSIDLNKYLIKKQSSTFFARTEGNSMIGAGITNNDLLVIDKSLEPEDGKIAVCVINGEFALKRLKVNKQGIWLLPENPKYPPLHITEENDFEIWGMVTYSIQKHY